VSDAWFAQLPLNLIRDPVYRSVSGRARLLLLTMLAERPDWVAVLALRSGAFAGGVGCSRSEVEDDLRALESAGLVVVDWEQEFVLLVPLLVARAANYTGADRVRLAMQRLADQMVGPLADAVALLLSAQVEGLSMPIGRASGGHAESPSKSQSQSLVPVSTELNNNGTSRARANPAGFEEFWAVYPRKVGKPKAQDAWRRAVARASSAAVLAGAVAYRDDPNREAGFTAHPTTWLNRDGWADAPLPTRERARSPTTTERMQAALAAGDRLSPPRQALGGPDGTS